MYLWPFIKPFLQVRPPPSLRHTAKQAPLASLVCGALQGVLTHCPHMSNLTPGPGFCALNDPESQTATP